MQTKKTIQKQSGPDKISISRIKQEMKEVYYLSDDLVILALDPNSPSLGRPVSLDGFAAIVMMSGEATLSINLNEYLVRPNDVVVFTPEVAINVVGYTEQASAYMIAFSKSFVNEIQIDLATSLPVYMRFGKDPVLHATSADVGEIRQVFQLIKTMLRSDKERYRHEIIRTLFTTAFYIITDLNQRERPANRPKGRGELIFEEFTSLLQRYNKRERNVGFYARQLNITPKYLSSVVKEVSGRTAARWIDESVILEAKTLLKYSGMSLSLIHISEPTRRSV